MGSLELKALGFAESSRSANLIADVTDSRVGIEPGLQSLTSGAIHLSRGLAKVGLCWGSAICSSSVSPRET